MNRAGENPQMQGYRRPVELEITDIEDPKMNNALLRMHVKLQELAIGEGGQDLVEYGLLVALVALVCISGISKVAGGVNTAFSNISNSLA
ncbi:MAG TPA: Flp family type IVb pilin [Terracidiphilus sp.]|jgi:Flp pilus assembly pilin Flp